MKATDTGDVMRLVTFRLGGDLFAADIHAIDRVLAYELPRTVPDVPDWIEGVIEFQGHVVPVVDLRRRFGLPVTPLSPQTRLIVFSSANVKVAGVVDAVLDVRGVGTNDLAPPPALFRGLAADYLRGLTRRLGALVVVLDVEQLFTSRDRLQLEPLATGPQL